MPSASRLRTFYLSYLSKPSSNRPIYRAIRRYRPRKILELGVGFGARAVRMIEVAGRFCPVGEIQFTGLDLFEARSAVDGSGVTLKMAHRLLRSAGARIQLVPGELSSGLARVANAVVKCLRRPRPEVWTSFTTRAVAAFMTLSPRFGDVILRKAWKHDRKS